MTFIQAKDLLEAAFYASTIIGIPVSILVFLGQKRNERSARELETYLNANAKYMEYLTLCLQYPDLDCFDVSISEPEVKASGLEMRKLILFTILISLLETGYLLYRRHKASVRRTQWQGWHEYMAMWASRTDFRRAWPVLGLQFDSDFVREMNQLLLDAKTESGGTVAGASRP